MGEEKPLQNLFKKRVEAGEMAQGVRASVALSKELGLVASTHMAAYSSQLSNPVGTRRAHGTIDMHANNILINIK